MPPNGTRKDLEDRLWRAADQLRANSSLTAQEYSRPILGLIFLKYADVRFRIAADDLGTNSTSGRRSIGKLDYHLRINCIPNLGPIKCQIGNRIFLFIDKRRH